MSKKKWVSQWPDVLEAIRAAIATAAATQAAIAPTQDAHTARAFFSAAVVCRSERSRFISLSCSFSHLLA
jgi:hypothetical protein